ncbi:MAG: FliH/SctL family protein [Bryobacteraceae bacterium]|jgi:flagellar assembly protein FliH
MLSKVLKDAEVEIAPVPWRRFTVSPASAAQPDTAAGDGEVAQLRARIAELEAAVETKSRQSYTAGVRAGEEAARRSLESGVHEAVQRLAATAAELVETRAETIRRAEADTVRLSIEIARRVLHREISVDGSALEALIKAAMEKLQAQEVYRVRIHPDQEKLVRACLDQTGRGQSIVVVSDPAQPEGGAVFEISRGSLDASVGTQLAEIERGLIDQLEAHV